MYKKLPYYSSETWLAKLGDEQRQVCLLTGNGEGWSTTLAWNPAAKFVHGYGSKLATGLADFVDAQLKQKRKLVGFVSYDIGYQLFGLKPAAKDDLDLPIVHFLAFDNYLEITPDATTVHYKDKDFLDETYQLQIKRPTYKHAALDRPFAPVMGRDWYDASYQKIKRYITDGDVYQVNLTHRLEAQTTASQRALFAKILKKTSTGFMAYIEGEDFAVHSASPERFVSITNGYIETFPVKGTRPRGQTPAQDQMLRRELLNSAKDAAELNMITDLLRNDLGKICQIGSVKVRANRKIMAAPNVFHTYSHVIGDLLPQVRPIEALVSMSPGGSITGCPKKRAMEIIDELEPTTRSVYCGSIIVIEPDGRLDSNIAIRTIIQKGKRLVLPVGGGVVHRSVGEDEYQETLDKARALIAALSD